MYIVTYNPKIQMLISTSIGYQYNKLLEQTQDNQYTCMSTRMTWPDLTIPPD